MSEAQQVELLTQLAVSAIKQWQGDFDSVSLIKYRENAVFRVVRKDGVQSVLRVHRAGYHSNAQLRSELVWMEELRRAGIAVPQLIRPEDGTEFIAMMHPGVPEARQVDMLSWLSGSPVGAIEEASAASIDELVKIYFMAGELAARVHNQATNWPLPTEFTRHSWDENGLIGDEPLWGKFWELGALDRDQRELILRVRDRLAVDIAAFGKGTDRYSMIHADLVPENLFLDDDGLKLIDFDDAGFGWHMFEIATALFFHLEHPDFSRIRGSILAGYRTTRSLSAEQEAALPMFLLLRSLTYLGWVHTRSETETARELTTMFVDMSCKLARGYLESTNTNIDLAKA